MKKQSIKNWEPNWIQKEIKYWENKLKIEENSEKQNNSIQKNMDSIGYNN